MTSSSIFLLSESSLSSSHEKRDFSPYPASCQHRIKNKLLMKITSKKISIEFMPITNNEQNNDEYENKTKQEATWTATAAKVFTKKVNANCFKRHRSYSDCFNFSNVGNFFLELNC